jgi:hypothetical protein
MTTPTLDSSTLAWLRNGGRRHTAAAPAEAAPQPGIASGTTSSTHKAPQPAELSHRNVTISLSDADYEAKRNALFGKFPSFLGG